MTAPAYDPRKTFGIGNGVEVRDNPARIVDVVVSNLTTYELNLSRRLPRINGDTRWRKKRLRKKFAKLDAVRFAPEIKAATDAIIKRMEDDIMERVIDPDGENAQRRAEVARLRLRTKEHGGHEA